MNAIEDIGMEIEAVSNLAGVTQPVTPVEAPALRPGPRINLEPDQIKNGLGQLVLTLVKMLHELLERQALRRIEAGTLTPDEIERIGLTLMRQTEEIRRLQREFGLNDEDLNLDLGPLGTLL
jgi:hypothetical protein